MKVRYGLALLAVAGLSALALLPALWADQPSKPAAPAKVVDAGSLPEVQDVLFFTNQRPVLLRIRLYVDGQPASERWEAFQKKLFAYLDVDGDGFLDKEEAKRLLGPTALNQFYSGNLPFNGGLNTPSFEDIDTDRDGKISPSELAAYYRRYNAGPFEVVTGAGAANTADQLTNTLFAALDADKDGKLSKDELAAADKVLMKFDDNDDELITAQELLATPANPYTPLSRPGGYAANSGVTSILLVPKEEGKSRVSQRLKIAKEVLAKYDKDHNGKLSRAESGFPKDMFDALDSNKDGALDAFELLRWVVATPDLECTVRLGRVEDNTKFIEPANDGKGRGGLQLNATSQTTLGLTLESSEVSVVRGGVARGGASPQVQNLRQQYKVLDAGKSGFITRQRLDNAPRFVFLKTIFPIAARDDEDKLTEKELEAFLDVATAASGCQMVVSFNDNGQGLFEMLDSDGDGRLSIREMRRAWNRLAAHAHDGAITKSDIPRQYALIVGGTPNPTGRAQFVDVGDGRMGPASRVPAAQRGPLWFRKMDVNGDGDVSEREFLGSREDFRRINTSGDGLISVEEAQQADAWFRDKLPLK